MRKIIVLSVLLATGVAASSASAALPSAKEILTSVRLQQAQQQIDLQGQLRENEKVIPFRLTQTGAVIRYTFSNPDESLQLRLGENDSRLEEVTREGVEKITPAQFDHKVRGTGVTYEDLALKFLYWQKAQVTAEESVRTRACWKLELKAPNRESQYSNVFLWVDKSGGALMRMEGYDWSGRLTKRFEVVSAQKIEGRWFLKQMRIEGIQPGTGKVLARTYLEIKK
ncbi:MAG TPA: outer membrane lipoprotein-sorting protein [Chthoniobacterales bacterium]|nr:outer membrane lipoprotein-sorting protein [Chthoniobacterales bacterium]